MKFSKLFYLIAFGIILSHPALSQTDIENEIFGLGQISGEELKLTDEQKKDFTDKALRKTKALSNYISIIADKSKEETQRSRAVDMAVKLFMSENSTVEISSLGKQTKRLKIRAYLNRLKLLPYYKVKISWFDIFFATNFTKRPDGKYEAIATIFQKFEGSNNDGFKYIDITKKNIQIIIEQVEIKTGDKSEKVWEVFLGDIKVEETRKE
jgi:hypothetical protein